MNKIKFLCNAFSLQMVGEYPVKLDIQEIDVKDIDLGSIPSAIGHADTAAVLGVEMHRENVSLVKGDEILVAQLQGGRLPEGSTTLPEGFSFKFLKVIVG